MRWRDLPNASAETTAAHLAVWLLESVAEVGIGMICTCAATQLLVADQVPSVAHGFFARTFVLSLS